MDVLSTKWFWCLMARLNLLVLIRAFHSPKIIVQPWTEWFAAETGAPL